MFQINELMSRALAPFLLSFVPAADEGTGGSEATEGEASTGAEATDGESSDQQTGSEATGSSAEGEQTAGKRWKEGEFNEETAARLIANKDADLARIRTNAKKDAEEAAKKARDELTKSIGKALGLVQDETPDPDALIKQLTTERDGFAAQISEYRQKDALGAAAKAHGGDVSLVTDVLIGKGALKNIDPAAEDYAAQVEAVVQKAIEDNPKLRAVQVPAQNSDGKAPAGSNTTQLTREELAKLSPADRLKAAREGRVQGVAATK